jgi:uncharacterized membrane protein YfcA
VSGYELIILGFVGFFLAILSGIAGGGGGFIMTPMLIFLGLSPAQAVATGKLGGFSMAVGSLVGMKSNRRLNKKILIAGIVLSILSGLLASKLIVSIDEDVYGNILGIALILLAPIMYIKKIGHQEKVISRNKQIIGYFGLFFALFLQGTLSGGMGIFVGVALMSGLGLDAIQSNVIKRITQLVLNFVIVLSLVGSGLILWDVAVVMIGVNLLGSAVGGHIAIKKGASFVSSVIAALALVSGIALLVS